MKPQAQDGKPGKPEKIDSSVSLTGISRREFIGGCAACAAGASMMSVFGAASASAVETLVAPAAGGGTKSKIRVVLAYPSPKGPIWPNINYDFESHNKQFLEKLSKACPGAEFLPAMVMNDDDAKKVADKDGEIDGYIVYLSGCLWGSAPDIIAATGKPVIYADHLYAGSGEFLTAYGRARRNRMKVAAVSSSRIEDVADAARCIDTITKIRSSRILVVGNEADKKIGQRFGTKIDKIEYDELNKAYEDADLTKTKQTAEQWTKGAEKVIEPSQEDVEKSAAMYLAMCELLGRYKAQAITVNCLGGFYSRKIKAYPCLGFMQLNNDGFVGACESDQRATVTMLAMTYLTGRPGFISDPVIDTSKNQIIYAHCVAPTRVFGPKGKANPYHLRSHSEDHKGACDRSLMPLGEMTTTVMFDAARGEVIMHQGQTIENVDEDMACRNKLAVTVKGDVYKLLNEWDQWGWHRVTYYGDYKRSVYNLATLMGLKVIEEA